MAGLVLAGMPDGGNEEEELGADVDRAAMIQLEFLHKVEEELYHLEIVCARDLTLLLDLQNKEDMLNGIFMESSV